MLNTCLLTINDMGFFLIFFFKIRLLLILNKPIVHATRVTAVRATLFNCAVV